MNSNKLLLATFLSLTLLICTPLSATYGLFQGKVRERQDQDERAFMSQIYETYSPFYTGPLLAPSGHVIPKGHVNVQPYLFWQKTFGFYTHDWHQRRSRSTLTLQQVVITQYGMTDFLDFNLTTQSYYNRSGDQHHFNYGDTQFTLGFQLLKGFLHTAWPACVLEAGMVFPTGKYHQLDPRKNGTDSTGSGSYTTTLSLNFQKSFNRIFRKALDPLNYHPFSIRWSFGYNFTSHVQVSGLNKYGGSPATKGRVKPGNPFTSVFAWEYSFTKRWVFATDWQYQYSAKTTFSGRDGGETMGGPSNQNWSVAPAIEFNFTENGGALIGVWFPFAGRNSDRFVSGIFSFTYLF